ncbi:hypothetical protein BYT27DRAFT_7249671 [Phlegmacium glaucopus]|nr:hypothetical protein BYT27DRAFT_7249671 [Phlegmacium glaucopus]
MNSHKTYKCKRGKEPMVNGDTDSMQTVTQKTILETRNDGTTVSKRVWVSLDRPSEKMATEANQAEMPPMDYKPANMSPPPERRHSYRTQKDYIQQYVNRIDEFLEALLSRQAMPAL